MVGQDGDGLVFVRVHAGPVHGLERDHERLARFGAVDAVEVGDGPVPLLAAEEAGGDRVQRFTGDRLVDQESVTSPQHLAAQSQRETLQPRVRCGLRGMLQAMSKAAEASSAASKRRAMRKSCGSWRALDASA
jgi:hypothetical protein